MNLGLKGRVALVTGSSQGIGRAIAELLGKESATVAVTYCRNREKGEAVTMKIREAGGEAALFYLDLSSEDSVRKAVIAVAETFGRIDILVNNAAVTEITSCKSTSEAGIEDWQTLIRVNVEGSLAVIHAVVPAMKARGWGRIVTISSILALGSRIQFGWYATAKATLHGLTRSLYREAGQHGVLINVVMPGLTLTERIVEHFPHLIPSAARSTPIQRLLTPEEVAPVVAFLCSPANTAITGEIIRTSGG